MRYLKHSVCNLEKCYALSTLMLHGKQHLLVGAEKHAPCYLLDLDGNLVDTVWEEPGGVMTMVPIPDREGVFLATQQFYSPNDSKQAKLVCAKFVEHGKWEITTIAELPFVHRFGILEKNGIKYVLACPLKSDHEYKDDWRFPGKLLAGVLSDDPSQPLQLRVIKEGLTSNHGYTEYLKDGEVSAIISCDEGVYRVTPPEQPGDDWQIAKLLNQSCSDAVMMDFDGDGEPELLTISPFHGDMLQIWHKNNGGYEQVYRHPVQLPFLHAIYSGSIYGKPMAFVGNRREDMVLLGFYYDHNSGEYRYEEVDRGCGPTNCMIFQRSGHPALFVANREIDEVAIYDIYD